jgi:hypothetical protein
MPYVKRVPIRDPAIHCSCLAIELLAIIWDAVKIRSGENAESITAKNCARQYIQWVGIVASRRFARSIDPDPDPIARIY